MFERPLKTFLLSFFIFILSLVVDPVKGLSTDDPNLPKISTVEEYQQLQERIHYLTSDDKNKRLESVYYLEKFAHYFEVKEGLLDFLLTELDRNAPDIQIMTIVAVAIFPFLSSQDANHLHQLKKRIDDRPKSSNISPHFLEQMTAFIDRVISKSPEGVNLYSLKDDNRTQNTLFTIRLSFLSSRSNSEGVEHIRSFRKGSLRFLTDELFFKDSYHSQARQQEANQVIEVLAQKRYIPILIGSEEPNKTIIRKVTQKAANIAPRDTKETYIIETTPSQINKMTENSSSNSSKARNLETYLEAILYIEEKLNVRIIVFMNKFHRLSASQMNVLHAYLQREKPIQLIAASTMQGYQTISRYPFDFREVIARQMSIKDLKTIMIESIIPNLQKKHFNFHISIKAIYDIIKYIYTYRDFQNESLIHAAEELLIDLLAKKRQRIALNRNPELYSQPIQITDEEAQQFILSLKTPHPRQQNTAHHEVCWPSLM